MQKVYLLWRNKMSEKYPRFIKEFSKKESAPERRETAEKIKTERAKHFEETKSEKEKIEKLRENISERERNLDKLLKEITGLQNEIEQISFSFIKKILNYFQLKKLRADLIVGEKSFNELKQLQEHELAEEQRSVNEAQRSKPPLEFREAKAILNNFYSEQIEKWVSGDYTEEELKKYFAEDYLASLSLEDYPLLLRRFPQEVVTHVTRQGIRDHAGASMQHAFGEGAYVDSFMRMCHDGRLRSPLAVSLVEEEKEKALEEFLMANLDLSKIQSEKEALSKLDEFINPTVVSGSFSDRMAIHFAAEEVADKFYGSEKGNEIFFVYPCAHIASQYYFSGTLTSGGGNCNDQWVWANEERGIDIDAGLVFIPESAKVDKRTGSRYELDENMNPKINEDYVNAFKKLISLPDFSDFVERIRKLPYVPLEEVDASELLEPFRHRIIQELGITDKRLHNALFNGIFTSKILQYLERKDDDQEKLTGIIHEALKFQGILFVETKDPISSKDFWENYFAKDPSTKPSKIVYYQGMDPTNALAKWRKEQGIDKKLDERTDVLYRKRAVSEVGPEALAGSDRFKALAEKVIHQHFTSTSKI